MKIEAKIHLLVIRSRNVLIHNRVKLRKVFGFIGIVLTAFSFLPLLSDNWRPIFLNYWSGFIKAIPKFISYFYDLRAFILYLVGLLLWIKLIYYKHEARFLKLALDNKRILEEELKVIKKGCPKGHYLGLIIGKLGQKALDVKDEKGSDIISAIDRNIKKLERVYWIAEDEIGIIFYEAIGKDESYFLKVIKNKLISEITENYATRFFNDIDFAKIEITDDNPGLLKSESSAKRELLKIINKKQEDAKKIDPAAEEEKPGIIN